MYKELTSYLDLAIESNDRNKPIYMQRRSEVISTFNEELSKHGMTVQKGGCYIATAVYGFVCAVSDFATHAKPLRETANYRENVFAKTIEGNPMIDKAYELILAA